MSQHDPVLRRILNLVLAAWIVSLVVALPRSASALAACEPNTEVCSRGTTLIAQQAYQGETGSARISFYPVPKEKGNRKGVLIWVFGFGPPQAAADCRDRADTGGTSGTAVTDPEVSYPVRLGFDLYTVDFCDPTDYLQRNGYVLKELIRDQIRPSLGSGEKFGIVASSMGGLISRYVLTQLESEGFDHSVDLWTTGDTPHKGAYIPLSVQFLGKLAGALPGLGLEEALKPVALADSNSARQMLVAHHLGVPPGVPHRDHTLFFQELAALGNSPRAAGLRTVARASGAGTGRAAHPVEGVTWRLPVDVSHPVPLNFELGPLKWNSSITLGFRGDLVVRLIPLTQTSQAVLRVETVGKSLVNGTELPGTIDSLTVANIKSTLLILLRLPSWVPSSFLDSFADLIKDFFADFLEKIDLSTVSTVNVPVAYEGLAGGLSREYLEVSEAFKGLPGETSAGSLSTFIPTFSSLATNHPPDADLTRLANVSTPFTEIVYQSRDQFHTFYESDISCRESRRLADVPYATRVAPTTRVAGRGAFTLTVDGGNFTPQTVVSWGAIKLPTTFISSARLTAEVSNDVIAEPTADPLVAADPSLPPPSGIVSVNNFNSQGSLPANQFYSDQAYCEIGVVVQQNAVKIIPASPTMQDQVTALVTGDWNTGCVPGNPQLTISGNQITITATNPGQFCTFAFTAYEIPVTFGPLAVGTYEVVLRDVRSGQTTELGRRAFSVSFARPSISLLQPGSATAGNPPFSLKVEGANFVSGASSVYWNGQQRSTTFISSSELLAQISAADIAAAGNVQITVRSSADAVSDQAPFSIIETPPSIASLNPDAVVENSGPVALRVIGNKYASDAVVLWTNENGVAEPLSTRFVSSTQLETTVPASRLTTPGSYPVAVLSRGITSAAAHFLVDRSSDGGTGPAPPTINATTNGASFTSGVSRGAIATIFGTNLANATATAASVPLLSTLAGAQVIVAGVAAPLFYVSPSQINFQVPFETPLGAGVLIHVIREGVAGPQSTLVVTEYALGIFMYERQVGARDPIITHANGSLVTPSNPAHPGEVVIVWATGVGALDNPPPTGAASLSAPLATSRVTPDVILAGSSSGALGRALFVGMAPGFAGLIQMNIELPAPRPPDPELRLGVRFRDQDQYLLVSIPVAQN